MSEFRGIVGLLIIVVLIDGFKLLDLKQPLSGNEEMQFSQYIVKAAPAEATKFKAPEPFMPDTVTVSRLVEMGFPKKVAMNLIAYRKKSGGFRNTDQIRSIYGMTDSLFGAFSEYLVIKKPLKTDFEDGSVKRKIKCPEPMDLNMADSAMLTMLHGIGPVLSARIVSYRSLLGGYVEVQQLREVFGLKEETYDHIHSRLYVDEDFRPVPIPVKTGTYRELYQHPYLNSRQAVMLLRYRQHHMDSLSENSILNNPVFSPQDAERLRPYLNLSDSSVFHR